MTSQDFAGIAVLISCCALSFGDDSTAANGDAKVRLPGHRNLYNGDCTFLFGDVFVADPDGKMEIESIRRYIDLLADNDVDTYLQNPNAQVPWYPSRRVPNILTGYRRDDVEFFRGMYRKELPEERKLKAMAGDVRFLNRYLDLADAGINWVEEISEACRRRGVSPWLSIRMNDAHGANSWDTGYINAPPQRDSRFRLSGKQPNPNTSANRFEQLMNYEHQEVRDYMLLMIRELVEDYDFEGLELDWTRTPHCLEPPATSDGLALMADWIGEIRKLVQQKSKAIGKPYLLGIRIPCRLGQVKAIGLDVPALARRSLIDFVCVSNMWQTTWDVPYDELRRELGDRVALYGVIEDAPNWMSTGAIDEKEIAFLPGNSRLLSSSPELLRGNAAGKLALGADGIETFNFFCSDEKKADPKTSPNTASYVSLKNLHDLRFLRGKPKQYALATMQGGYTNPLMELSEQLPQILEPGWKKTFRLSMCAEPDNEDMELVVQIIAETPKQPPELGVSFNGSWPNYRGEVTSDLLFPCGPYSRQAKDHSAWNFRFTVGDIKEGWNEVLVFHGTPRGQTASADERRDHSLKIVGVELALRTAADSKK